MAKLLDEAGIDMLLVGDSLGNVMLGYDSTIPVTMDEMIHHVKAVVRGTKSAMVVGDMPFLSYNLSIEESVRNAGRFLQEGGANAVKLEGGAEIADTVKAIVSVGIPVVGHIGLTPQFINVFGGFKVQGKDDEGARKLISDAKALEAAGAFAVTLEAIPAKLAEVITREVNIPTIGIGAGKGCDGQVLVVQDFLGMYSDFTPKFVKKFANIKPLVLEAVASYKKEVQEGTFPGVEHSYGVEEEKLSKPLD
jgi:3-methyl-2-oxobutanoate hydroxymethyltransferase